MSAALVHIDTGARYEIVGPRAVVGRGPSAGADDVDVIVPDPRVARRHFLLRRDAIGWLIDDLRSPGGTWVNQQRAIRPTPVAHGDIINDRFRFVVADAGALRVSRVGRFLAFAELDRAAYRAIPLWPVDGTHRFDIFRMRAPPLLGPDHRAVPSWVALDPDDRGVLAVRNEVNGPTLARILQATRHEDATLPDAAAVWIAGEIAGAILAMRSLETPPHVALSLENVVVTWEGAVRVLAFAARGEVPAMYLASNQSSDRAMASNGQLPLVHVHALGCVALELTGHDVLMQGPLTAAPTGQLAAWALQCVRQPGIGIEAAHAALVDVARDLGVYPDAALAALVRRLFADAFARETQLREELALLDDDAVTELTRERASAR